MAGDHEAKRRLDKWKKQADKQTGWSYYYASGSQNWVFLAPDGYTRVTVSENVQARSMLNAQAQLKRAGLKI